jgi:hypothetical protein
MRSVRLKRREFIKLLGGAGVGRSQRARSSQLQKDCNLGLLDATSRSTQGQIASVFVERLRELGWHKGKKPHRKGPVGGRTD